jgi:hypothetical protein
MIVKLRVVFDTDCEIIILHDFNICMKHNNGTLMYSHRNNEKKIGSNHTRYEMLKMDESTLPLDLY